MGSKSQIALPDIDEKSEDEATNPGADTRREAEVIPAFLPGRRKLASASEVSAQTQEERPCEDKGGEDDAFLLANAVGTGKPGPTNLPPIHRRVEDPELIELLEQLSATIDNANLVLSEAPPLRGPVADEYAAAGVGASAFTPPQMPAEKPARRGNYTAAVLAGVFLCAAAGGYSWFRSNPWLLDGHSVKEMALAVTAPAAETAAPRLESVAAKVPVTPPVAAMPVPAQKPRMTAALGPVEPAVPSPQVAEPRVEPAKTQAQPVRGTAGSPIRIDLALPARSDGQEISVMVQGVPKGVSLSRGSFIGGDTWVLTEQEAANLVLSTSASFDPQAFAVDVVFVKSDGKVPESRRIDIVVDPVHAPAPATNGLAAGDAGTNPPAPTPANVAVLTPASGGAAVEGYDKPEPEEKTAENTGLPTLPPTNLTKEQETKLLARGKELMDMGDVASARLIYGHAARLGSKGAMLALGKTYDPAHLASLGVRGVQPDKSQANTWYERASRQADR